MAGVLQKNGYVADTDEAFATVLSSSSKYYVPKPAKGNILTVIQLVRGAGGVPIIIVLSFLSGTEPMAKHSAAAPQPRTPRRVSRPAVAGDVALVVGDARKRLGDRLDHPVAGIVDLDRCDSRIARGGQQRRGHGREVGPRAGPGALTCSPPG